MMLRRFLICAFLFFLPSFLDAQENIFYKKIGEGQMLCLRRVESRTGLPFVEVCRNAAKVDGGVKGRLCIPERIMYDGESYVVVSIADSAFWGCEGLSSVELPKSLHRVGNHAFENCPSLKRLVVDCDSLAYAYGAFGETTRIDTLEIGKSARWLAPYLFSQMNSITVLLFNSERDGVMRNLFFGNTSHATMYVGIGVHSLPSFICYNFTGLQRVVYEGNGLREIGECAFVNCKELRTIQIPAGIESLGLNVYSYCIPQIVVFETERPPRMKGNPFYGVERYTYVVVPCGTRQYYVNSIIGNYFNELQYPEGCPLIRSGEVLYVHDTVWVHDTVYVTIPVEKAEEDLEEDLSDWLRLEGKVLCVTRPDRLAGRHYQLFDGNGRVVLDGNVPRGMTDEYRIQIPRRRCYYIGFEGLTPLKVDVPKGTVN